MQPVRTRSQRAAAPNGKGVEIIRNRNRLLRAAIALAIAACPSAALASQDLRQADAGDAARQVKSYDGQHLRSPDARRASTDDLASDVPREPFASVSESDDFDLGSAAIGAAAMLGIVLALIGGVLVVRPLGRRRRYRGDALRAELGGRDANEASRVRSGTTTRGVAG